MIFKLIMMIVILSPAGHKSFKAEKEYETRMECQEAGVRIAIDVIKKFGKAPIWTCMPYEKGLNL